MNLIEMRDFCSKAGCTKHAVMSVNVSALAGSHGDRFEAFCQDHSPLPMAFQNSEVEVLKDRVRKLEAELVKERRGYVAVERNEAQRIAREALARAEAAEARLASLRRVREAAVEVRRLQWLVAFMEDSQHDEAGFSDAEIATTRRDLEVADDAVGAALADSEEGR